LQNFFCKGMMDLDIHYISGRKQEMKKKNLKILSLVIIVTAFIATGCGNNQDKDAKQSTTTETTDTSTADTDVADASKADDTSGIEVSKADNTTAKDAAKEVFTQEPVVNYDVNYTRVSVHDPSVIKADGMYYIFGSHRAWAKSSDLMNWTAFTNNVSTDYETLLGNIWNSYCKTDSNPNLAGNMWAPDVIYNDTMKKYCMYMSVNGDDYNSAIVLLTADSVEGPYSYAGEVVFSGFGSSEERRQASDVYKVLSKDEDMTRYKSTKDTKINAIDPSLEYDADGNLWMSYGSWFGGIYMLKLDTSTGLRDYSYTYTTEKNLSDEYHGYKIAGGQAVSGEGSYILRIGNYYYMFLSYGGLTAEGGYQMRIFRSDTIYGPYTDELGNSSVYTKSTNNILGTVGIRLMGSYSFSGNTEIHVSQGHNSAFVDDDGKIFVVYHTRFAGGKNGIKEAHEVRVQQLFVNKDGWLVAAPYEYAGETIADTGYTLEQMTGEYQFVQHLPYFYYHLSGTEPEGIADTLNICLNSDFSVTGDVNGTWTYEKGTANMTITIDDVEYKGVFVKAATEGEHKEVTTFTALGNNICVWGSKN